MRHPFERAAQSRIAPFAIVACAALATLPVGEETNTTALVLGVAASIVLGAVLFVVPWQTMPGWARVLPALAYFPAIMLLREGAGGGTSGLAFLTLLPVVWLALYSSKRAVSTAVVLTALTFVLPIVLIGAPDYPDSEWRRAFLGTAVAALVGWVVQRLVAELRAESALSAREAQTDALTGVLNRRALDMALSLEMQRAGRTGASLCVLLADLDRFKAYNDQHGHRAGDELLQRTTAAWQSAIRAADTLARYGGEEFVVIASATQLRASMALADRLRSVMPDGQTCSVGVAQWDGRESAVELLDRADAALYEAKRSGRNRVIAAEGSPATGPAEHDRSTVGDGGLLGQAAG